jgi:hypothetical protein
MQNSCVEISKIFNLGTHPIECYEYMRLPIALIPTEIIEAYNLLPLVHNGHIYVEIRRGMYGLPQAGILANQLLTERLEPHRYYQCCHTPGLWRHKWRPIMFSLVVDDSEVKYEDKEHADRLIASVEKHYMFYKDWDGQLYCGIQIKWDYLNRTIDLSMPGYIVAMLHKYQHPANSWPQHAPYKWNEPIYGAVYNSLTPLIRQHHVPGQESNGYNKSREHSYTTHAPSIPPCLWHSEQLQPNK